MFHDGYFFFFQTDICSDIVYGMFTAAARPRCRSECERNQNKWQIVDIIVPSSISSIISSFRLHRCRSSFTFGLRRRGRFYFSVSILWMNTCMAYSLTSKMYTNCRRSCKGANRFDFLRRKKNDFFQFYFLANVHNYDSIQFGEFGGCDDVFWIFLAQRR